MARTRGDPPSDLLLLVLNLHNLILQLFFYLSLHLHGECFRVALYLFILNVKSTHHIFNIWGNIKEINPEYSLEGLILKLKLQYLGHLMRRTNIRKDPVAGKDWRQEEKGVAENEMVGWHHRLNRHEFEQTLGDSKGQGSLVCCSPWDHKESDMTEQLNNNYIEW